MVSFKDTIEYKKTRRPYNMATILEATTTKQLGLSKTEVSSIKKLFTKSGMSARNISYETGVSRRKVMKALEIEGLTSFSEGSYL